MRLFARVTALCVLASLPLLCSAATLLVYPSTQTVTPGAVATVQVGITGLGDMAAPSLSGFDFQLSYDPAILELDLVAHGDPMQGNQLNLNGFGTIAFDDTFTPGVARMVEVSFDWPDDLNTYQRNSFVLASLFFRAVGVGTSPLTLEVNTLGDELGNPLEASVLNGSVTVGGRSAVPEPGVFFLCGSGLIGLAVMRYRRRNSC